MGVGEDEGENTGGGQGGRSRGQGFDFGGDKQGDSTLVTHGEWVFNRQFSTDPRKTITRGHAHEGDGRKKKAVEEERKRGRITPTRGTWRIRADSPGGISVCAMTQTFTVPPTPTLTDT